MKNIKSATQIRKEKPYYFVSTPEGTIFESNSITECKEFLIKYIKENNLDVDESYECFIGMYNIDIERI